MSGVTEGGPSRVVYEGSARNRIGSPPGEGDELLFRNALLDAYEAAKEGERRQGNDGPYTFRVVDIIIEGSNPPSDYKVTVVRHP
jgi:hypothetical protein